MRPGFGVADLAVVLAGAVDREPGDAAMPRTARVAGALDRFADACGDAALIHDARVLAAAARRTGRDITTALSRLHDTTPTSTDATGSGRLP